MKRFTLSFLYIFLFACVLAKGNNSNEYQIKLFTGTETQQIIPFITQLWLTYFREYPYLYVGTEQEVHEYYSWFMHLKHTAIAVAYHNQTPVGFLTGTALIDQAEHFTDTITLFHHEGLNPADFFYCGEGIIVAEHRGNSLLRLLNTALEEYVKKMGYSKLCFIYESHTDHPLKPLSSKELDTVWRHFGYVESSITTHFTWNTIQPDETVRNQEHALRFWIKDLNKAYLS